MYGERNGKPLKLDVIQPSQRNGLGVLFLVSGGWKSSDAGWARLDDGTAAATGNGSSLRSTTYRHPRPRVMEIPIAEHAPRQWTLRPAQGRASTELIRNAPVCRGAPEDI